MSFINERVQPEGLTFDDVLLIPAYSEVLPREVSVQTRFSRNIKLNIPIVSAAMDTVTEAPMAIALAREGGIGVIHKNMSIAEQAAHVRRVKRAENGMIYDPVTISKDHTVGDALNLMKENKIGGIPVVDADRKLIGIVTNRDLRFQRDMSRRIEEVMTPGDRLITTHSSELSNASEVLLNCKIEKLPVVDDAGRYAGTVSIADIRLNGHVVTDIAPLVRTATPTVHSGDDAKGCFEQLISSGASYLVVLGEAEQVEGIITKTSMASAMAEQLWG